MTSTELQTRLSESLQAALDVNGSLEYSLTWKAWGMPQREPICALRASARRISDNAVGGWPTADASAFECRDVDRMLERREECRLRTGNGNGLGMTLGQLVQIVGYPTCNARDHKDGDHPSVRESGRTDKLGHIVQMAGYHTPVVRDHRNSAGDGANPRDLPRQASGVISTCSHSETEKRGALNPAHSRWLMGYPVEWLWCAPSSAAAPRFKKRTVQPSNCAARFWQCNRSPGCGGIHPRGRSGNPRRLKMTNTHNPALYCQRCAFRPATRHVGNDRTCDDCLDGREKLEIATWPVNVHEREDAP